MYRADNNSMVESDVGQSRATVSIFVVFLILLLFLVAQRPVCAQPTSEEYRVKAAFLFHFAQLVEWPADALNANDQSLYLCMFNDEPRRQELQSTIEGKIIESRVLRVRVLDQPQEIQGCNILFLGKGEARRQAATLRGLSGQPVLTVGETDNFLSDGGMIRFHLDGDKIRFDINGGGANSSHLKISSRLLLLATSVTLGDGVEKRRSTYAH